MLDIYGECYVILTAIAAIAIVKMLTTSEKCPILNVYRTQSNLYNIKLGLMYTVLRITKLVENVLVPCGISEKFDKPLQLPIDKYAIDGVYFNGSNVEGDRFSIGINRRNNKETESYTFLKLGSLKTLITHETNPFTFSYKVKENNKFSATGFNIVPVISTRKWKIKFNGKMKNSKNSTLHDVKLNLIFTSDFPIFNYGKNFNNLHLAKALAVELWNIEYFNTLKEFNSLYYGQFGTLIGTVTVDQNKYKLNMNAYRDHIVAKNFNWETYHRCIVHYINVENGDQIVISKICRPIILSNFSQGFIYRAQDNNYHPLQSCNLELYQHGEVEEPPMDYAFSFEAGNKQYTVHVNVNTSVSCYIGRDWNCRLVERQCTIDVNGKKGWGSCQWFYKNVNGKCNLQEKN